MKNSINDFMSKDHDRLDGILKEYEKNARKKSPKAKQLFFQFKKGLEQHIVWEEEILFPLFESKTGINENGPTTVMRLEHKEIKKSLEEIFNKITKENLVTDHLEKQLIEILSDHNDKEEMIVYPWIDDSIDEETRKKNLHAIKKSIK